MSHRKVIFLAAAAALGITCISADAQAAPVTARGGAVMNHGTAVGARGSALAYRGGYGRGYYRPGLGVAAGVAVGGAIAASQPYGYGAYGPGYGYASYGYDSGPGAYAYDPGYAAGDYAAAAAYGPYGYGLPSDYQPGCTYVGGPKSMDWACR